jgi:signal transduction histidine kinase/ActR/RegA family two-component response regulator
MFAVLACVTQGHDLRLVAVAALICAIACAAAFGFHQRSQRTVGAARWAWAGLTGLVAGSGVWATHFTAMLAYQPSLPIHYDAATTAESLAIAIVGMTAGFAAPMRRGSRSAAILGGAFTGLSIGAMHYTGIAAVRTQAHLLWDMSFVAASLAIAVTGGAAAFVARRSLPGGRGWAAAALLVLAICGLHFTAMTAVILKPDPTLVVPGASVDRGVLATATVGLAALIFTAAASLFLMERLGRRATLTSLRHALDAAPLALAFYDPGERLIACNQAFADLHAQWGVEAVPGVPRRTLIEAVLRAGWFGAAEDGVERQVASYVDREVGPSEILLPDGRWLRYESSRTPDGGGVTVFTDITAQKQSVQALAAARDAAEAANRAKSEFLANMSHEIRTPLNGVLSVADLLGRTRLSGRQRELVGVIRQSGGLLNALLADLLDLARVEAGMAELRPERTAVGELVGSVRDLFAGAAEAKGLVLRAEIRPGAEADVACDDLRLRQVLGNLVSNAVKFADAGEVVLSVARSGEALRFEVRDTGPGFDDSRKAALFQRFFQGDATTTRRHGGAGLGLAICDQYVRLMGGELDCASRPGAGATFGFTLQAPALTSAAAAAPDNPIELPGGGGMRVLVVDDNVTNRQILQMILESAGIEHAAVEDGAQALEAATTGGFDAVLMDIQMPVMDGFEATRRIRAWEREAGRRRAPIYMVSANCLQEHVDAGRAAGADGHLAKPVSVAELLQTLLAHPAGGEGRPIAGRRPHAA